MTKQLKIILVEDNDTNQKKMSLILEKLFECEVVSLSHGIEAINYLLAPTNEYNLVILDGKLRTHPPVYKNIPIDGPDVANAMKEQGITVPVVLWTNDPEMLARFDEVYGRRLPEIEKPGCREYNVAVVLTPIIALIRHFVSQQQNYLKEDENQNYSPTAH